MKVIFLKWKQSTIASSTVFNKLIIQNEMYFSCWSTHADHDFWNLMDEINANLVEKCRKCICLWRHVNQINYYIFINAQITKNNYFHYFLKKSIGFQIAVKTELHVRSDFLQSICPLSECVVWFIISQNFI